MATTITKEPNVISLGLNQIILEGSTDSYQTFAGSKRKREWVIDQVYYIEDTPMDFLHWGENNAAVFFLGNTATVAADTTGKFIEIPPGGTSVGAWILSYLIPGLKKNILLDAHFALSFTAPDILAIEAREPGEAFNDNTEHQFYFNPYNTGSSDTVNGSDPTWNSKFYMVAQLFVENGDGSFTSLAEVAHKPLEDGSFVFDFNEDLWPFVQEMALPDLLNSDICHQPDVIIPYRIALFEKTNTSMESVWMSPTLYVMEAGVRTEDLALHPDPVETWIKTGKRWLTWQPDMEEVDPGQPVFLSWLNTTGGTVGGGGAGT